MPIHHDMAFVAARCAPRKTPTPKKVTFTGYAPLHLLENARFTQVLMFLTDVIDVGHAEQGKSNVMSERVMDAESAHELGWSVEDTASVYHGRLARAHINQFGNEGE